MYKELQDSKDIELLTRYLILRKEKIVKIKLRMQELMERCFSKATWSRGEGLRIGRLMARMGYRLVRNSTRFYHDPITMIRISKQGYYYVPCEYTSHEEWMASLYREGRY